MFGFAWRRRPPALPDPAPEPKGAAGGFATLFGEPERHARPQTTNRTVAIIGNCLAQTLKDGLSAHPVTAGAFDFVAVPLHLGSLDTPETQAMLRRCAHIFLQTTAKDDLAAIRAACGRNVPIDLFPDVALRSLWPFDAQSGYRDERIVDTPEAVIRHTDGVLARLRTDEPDPVKRFDRYRRLDFEEAATIARIAEAQSRFLAYIDEETDMRLGEFISAGFRARPMFYNATHPAGIVFQSMAEFIWRRLGMAGRAPVFTRMDDWKCWSVPVHPGIARMLGVTWATETTRYSYATLGEVTWEEWVKAYIQHLG